MSFTHVQGAADSSSTSTSFTVVLGANPTTGNLVCVGVAWGGTTPTGLTVKDSANNSYTILATVASNSNTQAQLAYLLSAPANATKTITVSWTNSSNGDAFADEFSATGTIAFDKESSAGTGSGTSINTPSITPTGSGELLYAVAAVASTVTAPTAGGTAGVWIGAAGNIGANGHAAEYDLSAGSATAVNFTQSPTGNWAALSMAFSISASVVVSIPWYNLPTSGPSYAI